MISHAADSDRALGGSTQRHVARCSACRQFHESCQSLGRRLRDEAARAGNASELHTQRILAAVGDRPGHARRVHWPVRVAAAACLAVAVLVAGTLLVDRSGPPESPPGPTRLPAPPNVDLARVIQNPLATELENLTADTRSGVRFLVACLDVSPAPAGDRPAPRRN
jgi:hypothetical protein